MNLPKHKVEELTKFLARMLYPNKIERYPLLTWLFEELINNAEVKSTDIENKAVEFGISKYRVKKWMKDLKNREILDNTYRGKPKVKGYWVWMWNAEFKRFITYMNKIL